jgi:hypothetical protein
MMIRRLLMLCVVAMLGACHRDSQQAAQPPPVPQRRAPVAVPRRPAPEESTAGMVEAASQGKSQMPVSLKFDLLQRPIVGQPLEIAIALTAQIPASPATVDVTGADGLQLASGVGQIAIPAVEPAQVYRQSIKVTPMAEGVAFLNLNVTLKHDEMTESRLFSVPIIVAAAADNPANLKP